MIVDKETKLKKSNLSFITGNSKLIQEVSSHIIYEDNLSKSDHLSKKAQDIETKNNSLIKSYQNDTNSTINTKNSQMHQDSDEIKHFQKIIIKPLNPQQSILSSSIQIKTNELPNLV